MRMTFVYFIVILVLQSLSFTSCEERGEPSLFIKNNSDESIVIAAYNGYIYEQEPYCIKPVTSFEYRDFIRDYCIEPNSTKGFDFNREFNYILHIDIFSRADMDTLSCEEFKERKPIKKRWDVTQEELEAMNWTLVYP